MLLAERRLPELPVGPALATRSDSRLGRSLALLWLLVALLALGLIPPTPAFGQAPEVERVEQQVETPEEKQKREAVVAGSLILILVVIAGIGLLAMVLILGRRMRRLTRQTLPGCKPQDDLWFLRKPKATEPERSTPPPD